MFKQSLIVSLLLCFSIFDYAVADDEYIDDGVFVKQLYDLEKLSQEALKNKKAILIEFAAADCPYCVKVEEYVLKPMLRSKDYADKVLMRSVYIDQYQNINGWCNKDLSPKEIQNKYNVFVTPTIIIIDHLGNEIGKRQIGINTVDYYSYYLDKEIEKAVEIMNKKKD